MIANKGPSSQGHGFSNSHVWMWELDYKAECWRIDALSCGVGEDLRVPWTARRSSQSILNEMSWIFIGRTDVKAETPKLWPPDVKNWLFGKDPDAGKDWRQEEKGMTEDEMVGWHHWLNGHEFEQALRVVDGQGSLVCCSPWGRKETRLSDLSTQSKFSTFLVLVS